MYKLNLLFFPFILLYQIKLILGVKSEEILKKRKLQNVDSFKILDSLDIVSTSEIPKFSFRVVVNESIGNDIFIRGNLRNSKGDFIKINCGASGNDVSCIPIENYSSLLPLTINEIYYFDNQGKQVLNISQELLFYNLIKNSTKYHFFDSNKLLLNLSLNYESEEPISFIFKNSKNDSDNITVTGTILNDILSLNLSDLNPGTHYILYYNEKISSDMHVYIREENSSVIVLGEIKMEQCYKNNSNLSFEIEILYNNTKIDKITGKLNSSTDITCNILNISSLHCQINATIPKGKYEISFGNNNSFDDPENTDNIINIILLDNSLLKINPNYPTYNSISSKNGIFSIDLNDSSEISFNFKPKFSQISSYNFQCGSEQNGTCVINSHSISIKSLPYTDYYIYLNDETCGETNLNTVFTPSSKRVVKNITSTVNFTTCNYKNSNSNFTITFTEDGYSINGYNGSLVNSGNNLINFSCQDVCTLQSLPNIGGNYYLGVLYNSSSQVIIPSNIAEQPIRIQAYPNNITLQTLYYNYGALPVQLNFSYEEKIEIDPLTLQFTETRFTNFTKDVNCNVNSNDPSKLICLISNYTILPQGIYDIYYNNCISDNLINIGRYSIIQSSPSPGQLNLTYLDIDVCLNTSLPKNISFSASNSTNAIEIKNGFIFNSDNILNFSKGNINNGILNMAIEQENESETFADGDYMFGNVYYTLNDINTAAYLNDYQNIVFHFNKDYNPIDKDATNIRQSITYNENVTLVYTQNLTADKTIFFLLNNNNDNNNDLKCVRIQNSNKCTIEIGEYSTKNYLERGTYNLKEKNACGFIEDLDVIVYVETGMTFQIEKTTGYECTNLNDFEFYLTAKDRKENATNITGKLTDNDNISFDFSCTDLTITENNKDEIKCTVLPFNGTFTGNKKLYVSGINYFSNNILKGTSVTNSVENPIIFNYDYNPYKRDSNTKSFSIDFNSNIYFDIYFTKNATKNLEKQITLYNSNDTESHSYNYTLAENSDKLRGNISEINGLLVANEYSLKILTECGENETTDIKINISQMEVNDANFGENSESICSSTLANFTIEIKKNGIRNNNSINLTASLLNINNNKSISKIPCSFESDSVFTCDPSGVEVEEGTYQLEKFQYNSSDANITEKINSFNYYPNNNPLNDTLTTEKIKARNQSEQNALVDVCFSNKLNESNVYFIATTSLNITKNCNNNNTNGECVSCDISDLPPDNYTIEVINKCDLQENVTEILSIKFMGSCDGVCNSSIGIDNFDLDNNSDNLIKEKCVYNISQLKILLNNTNDPIDVNELTLSIKNPINSTNYITYNCTPQSIPSNLLNVSCTTNTNENGIQEGKYVLYNFSYSIGNEQKNGCVKNCTSYVNYNPNYNPVIPETKTILYNLSSISHNFPITFKRNISNISSSFSILLDNEDRDITSSCQNNINVADNKVNCEVPEDYNCGKIYSVKIKDKICGNIEDTNIKIKYFDSIIIGNISIISCENENTKLQAIIDYNPYDDISNVTINIILKENDMENNSYNETFNCSLDENNITCLINKKGEPNNYTIKNIQFSVANQNNQIEASLKKKHILLFYDVSKVKTSIRTINACMNNDFKIQLSSPSILESYEVFAINNETKEETELNITGNKLDSKSVILVNLTDNRENLCGNVCENQYNKYYEKIGYYVIVSDNCGKKQNTSMKIICKNETKIEFEKSKSNESFNFPKSVKGEYIKINKIVMLLFLFFI